MDLRVSGDLGKFPRDSELTVFRIVQECLTNIHRHSGSKTALINVTHRDCDLIVIVRDQGKGMPPERLREIQSGGSGVGIQGMRERIRHLQGTLTIDSNASGTRVHVSIPVPAVKPSQPAPALRTPLDVASG